MKTLEMAVPSTARKTLARSVATCLLTTIAISQPSAFAQTSQNVHNWTVTVEAPNVVLQSGQSATISILVGDAAMPVDDAVGYSLAIELDTSALASGSLKPSNADTWIESENVSISEVPPAAGSSTYTYNFSRDDQASGHGTVLQLVVKASENNTPASRLVKSVGGLMQIDNLDLRTAAPAVTRAWPNPTRGLLQVEAAGGLRSMQLIALDGRTLASFGPESRIDLSTYPKGIYILRIENQLNQLTDERVVVD